MPANRRVPTSGIVSGASFTSDVNEEIGALWDRAACSIDDVGGTANAITGTVTPAFVSGLVPGMLFILTPVATNTGAVTLALNALPGFPVLNAKGQALTGGLLEKGATYPLYFTGTGFLVLGNSTLTNINDVQEFTTAGNHTWVKPTNCPPNAQVEVWMWGAGGGGGASSSGAVRAGGGGGGGFQQRSFRASELPSTVACVVGAGGNAGTNIVAGTAGGNSTFGTFLTAYGGGGGFGNSAGGGGGGAGGSTTSPGGSAAGVPGGVSSGLGFGHSGGNGGTGPDQLPGNSIYGGGGGGGSDISTPTFSGNSFWGGGGGAAAGISGGAPAGTSQRGGNGGAAGQNGQAPGGGGGAAANGAPGRIIVFTRG